MQEMIYVKLFADDLIASEELNYEEKGRLFEAMIIYATSGEKPNLPGNERFVFPWLKARIDREKDGIEERKEVRKQAAQSRWSKTKEDANVCKPMQTDANDANAYSAMQTDANDAINNRIIENRIIEEKKIERENNTRTREEFSPPTEKDVKNFCKEQGIIVNAKRFVSFYASKGWMVGNTPMQDWKAAVLAWAAKDEEKADNKPKLLKSYDISEIEQLFADDIAEISRGAGNDLQRTG